MQLAARGPVRARPAVWWVLPPVLGEYFGAALTFTAVGALQESFYGATLAPVAQGLSQGVKGLLAVGCAPLMGAWSDRVGRAPVMAAALGVTLLPYTLLVSPAIQRDYLWVFDSAVALTGVVGGTLFTAFAYVADCEPTEKRARSFGLVGAMLSLGFGGGPVAGIGIEAATGSITAIFEAVTVVNVFVVVFILVLMPESRSASQAQEEVRRSVLIQAESDAADGLGSVVDGDLVSGAEDAKSPLLRSSLGSFVEERNGGDSIQAGIADHGDAAPPEKRPGLLARARAAFPSHNRQLKPALVAVLLFTLSEFAIITQIILYLLNRFDQGNLPGGIVLGLVAVCGFFSQTVLIQPLQRWIGRRNTALVGLIFNTLMYLALGFGWELWMIYAGVCFSAGSFLAYPVLCAIVSSESTELEQGVTQAWLTVAKALGSAFSPIFFGGLFAGANELASSYDSGFWRGSPWFVAAALSVAGAAVILRMPRPKPVRGEGGK